MYGAGSMVANRTSATANGKVLRSGGQVNIKATMNGKEVFANKYGLYFKQSAPSEQPMSLYYGSPSKVDEVVTWEEGINTYKGTTTERTTWDTATQRLITKYTTTVIRIPWYYGFDSCVHFNFINCDCTTSWGAGITTTNITVTLPDNSFCDTNTQAYIIYTDIKTAVVLSPMGVRPTMMFGSNRENNIPVGKPYKVVAVANKNGSYFYYESSGTITENMSLKAEVAPDSYGDIKARLHAL
jgi:hypothetical protein